MTDTTNNAARRPSFSATLVKKHKKFSKLGLQFGAKPLSAHDPSQYIVFLAKVSGAFSKKTFLVPGLQVLSVNQTIVTTPEEALEACERIQVGHIVSIEVAGSLHKAVKKKSKSILFGAIKVGGGGGGKEKVGISIKQVDNALFASQDVVGDGAGDIDGRGGDEQLGGTLIQITAVEKDGLFPKLKVGSILHSVNGQVATSFKKTLGWLKNSKQLTLIVLDPLEKEPNSPIGGIYTAEDTTTDAAPISPSHSIERLAEAEKMTTSKDRFPTPLGLVEINPSLLVQNSSTNIVPTTTKIDPIIKEENNGNGAPMIGQHVGEPNIYSSKNMRLRVIACVMRPTLDIPLGITFRQDPKDGGVMIVKVDRDGIFAHTGLEANQKIVRINGHTYPTSTQEGAGNKHQQQQHFDQAVDLLLQAKGRVTIEATTVGHGNDDDVAKMTRERRIFSIQKAKRSLQLDIGLQENVRENCVQITKVSPTLDKVLGLKNGLQLRYVNGKACNPYDISSVHKQMDGAFPILSLECIGKLDPPPPPPPPQAKNAGAASTSAANVRVVACIIRPDVSVDLGLTFRRDIPTGCLIVDTVASNGLFAHTGIRANQKIIKINGHPYAHITALKLTQALQLLQESQGRLTIEAETVLSSQRGGGRIGTNIFSIQKAKKSFQLGLGLQQVKSPGRPSSITICNVSPTLEKVLGLKKGLELLRINGVPCDANNIPSIHAQMDMAFPMLSLECREGPVTPAETRRTSRLAVTTNTNTNTKPPVVEEKKNDETEEDDESWMLQEYAMAEEALPIPVFASNKSTAKIVRTVVVEIPKAKLLGKSSSVDRLLGLTLAKHRHLNAIVITHIADASLVSGQFCVGQVMVGINHISCPLTTESTFKMLRRKAKEGPGLRIEAGDVEHVMDPHGFGHKQTFRKSPAAVRKENHDHAAEEAEAKRMTEAIRIGMLKATDEEIKEEYDMTGPVYSDDMEFDDFAPMPKIHMEGLPPELFPNKSISPPQAPAAATGKSAQKKSSKKKKKNPVYYQDEHPEVFDC
mmetsp:Transcript_29869/g.71784  ORF Transcript_29869/g.71784 Transcript_29869/m.71784 type:complete len:1032 (+) Transcript_29869:647-3742(+)|eukprot:CAMPEP_0113606188 /NCGR_PEP_ID=MMETSP0017_2-20120614/2723_1 /TAXON_ID=2856 /ORGANISM="Cylindrotheca closterium" /LENGTH=1031 /DNA_ID=CAMNT_0000514719 /DNA_START=443 /DNA_END=3538 /DNA_ORIENTATION=- /assembly_acc=CAM_ASM_000147